jgi:hypothetical protein
MDLRSAVGLAMGIGLAACSPINTVPPPLTPTDPVQHYDLEIPESLDIRSVEFTATTFADVSGYGGTTGSKVGGRAFLQVYAVHRDTGDQYVLLYEDLPRRKQPVQVIRFRAGPDTGILNRP